MCSTLSGKLGQSLQNEAGVPKKSKKKSSKKSSANKKTIKKNCNEGYNCPKSTSICNPASGRCVSKYGPTGKKLLEKEWYNKVHSVADTS